MYAALDSWSCICRRDVEGSVEDDHEQAGLTGGGGVMMDASRLEVGVRAGGELLPVGVHRPLEHDDRVRGGVAMAPGLEAGRVADQIVLGAGYRVLVEQPQPDGTVVDDWLGLVELERRELRLRDHVRC